MAEDLESKMYAHFLEALGIYADMEANTADNLREDKENYNMNSILSNLSTTGNFLKIEKEPCLKVKDEIKDQSLCGW